MGRFTWNLICSLFTIVNSLLSLPILKKKLSLQIPTKNPDSEIFVQSIAQNCKPRDKFHLKSHDFGENQPQISRLSDGLDSDVMQYVSAALSPSTRKAYQGDLADFIAWGGMIPCSPQELANYISERAKAHCPQTITRRVVGISRAHTSAGYPDPSKNDLVRMVLRGVRRMNQRMNQFTQRQATPLLKQDLLALLPHFAENPKGLRDKSLLLLGFAAALRRSELINLNIGDIAFVPEGMVLHLRRSKTDQEGIGRKIGIPYGRTVACPVKATRAWIEHLHQSQTNPSTNLVERAEDKSSLIQPLFRSITKSGALGERLTAQSVALIIKSYAKASGLDEKNLSGHSLRSGLVTSAAGAGISSLDIRRQTGHKSDVMLSRYIREANLFMNNAAGIL